MKEKIGFVGLGAMGTGMASNLMQAGYSLIVYNRTVEKAKQLASEGASIAQAPGETVDPDGIVISMVENDQALEEVTLGKDGLVNALGENGIHLSMSTVSPDLARRLAREHALNGSYYIAGPVFGKPDVAAAAKLWIAIAGDPRAKERLMPVLNAMGQGIYDFGEDPSAANVVKLAGNFLLGAAIEAMAEAFTLAQKNGVPRNLLYDMLTETMFACPAYKNYGRMIAEERYEPVGAIPSLIRKDMDLVLQTARGSLVPMPFCHIVHQRLTTTVAKGRDDIDWAGFAHLVSEDAGLS